MSICARCHEWEATEGDVCASCDAIERALLRSLEGILDSLMERLEHINDRFAIQVGTEEPGHVYFTLENKRAGEEKRKRYSLTELAELNESLGHELA